MYLSMMECSKYYWHLAFGLQKLCYRRVFHLEPTLKVFYSSWSEVILFFKIKRSLIDFLLKRNKKFQRANIIFALSCTLTAFMHVVWNLKWFSIYDREISKSKVSQHLFSFPEQKCCHLEFSINHGLQFAHPYTALPVHTKV